MKAATEPWIEYTNRRKADLENAKEKERTAPSVPLFQIEENRDFKVPVLSQKPGIKMANISYQKPRDEVERAAEVLGDTSMTYKRVGENTFEYFMEHEVEEDD